MEGMQSDDSRPDSVASNTSNSSDDTENMAAQSSPAMNEDQKSFCEISPRSTATIADPISRASSKSSNALNMRSSRSHSKSDSDSSSSSSFSENEEDDTKLARDPPKKDTISSLRSSSEESSGDGDEIIPLSRNLSISPTRESSPSSSRNSSSSTNQSEESNSKNGALNVSHEDLSDVSDIDCERRDFKNESLHSVHDDNIEKVNVKVANENKEKDRQCHLVEDNCGNHSFDDNNTANQLDERRAIQSADDQSQNAAITDLRQKLDKKKNQLKALSSDVDEKGEATNSSKCNGTVAESLEHLVKAHDEDALDFEAEEGECQDVSNDEKAEIGDKVNKIMNTSLGDLEDGEELEEGEVSDEDEKRPEETEPRPVCRFYTRGQCTWGTSCRFLHPGVTDKGNYTMFDLVRPVPVPQSSSGAGGRTNQNFGSTSHENFHDYRTDRPPLHHRAPLHHPMSLAYSQSHNESRAGIQQNAVQDPPVVVESAWERGLRTAKEMMRKANKRKEQDMDFEDKKMNLTLSPDELEKDPYYIKDRTTPPDAALSYSRHSMYQDSSGIYSPPERFMRGPPLPVYDELDPYGRSSRYRELPPHRMPQYEDDRRVRPAREVIVQRVEPVGRGDEWNDPWMRSKSPGGRALSDRDRTDKRRRDCRSFSSHSSYSTTSTSQSDTSSGTSRSLSPLEKRRRYSSSTHKSPVTGRRHVRGGTARSPSLRRKRSPSVKRRSPILKHRTHLSPSPALEKRNKYSPMNKRKKISPIKKPSLDKTKSTRNHRSSTSPSGSSDSSATDSDSSASSSSGTSSRSREKTPAKRLRAPEKISNERKVFKKEMPKKRSPISIEIKKQAIVGTSALTSPTNSVSSEKDLKKTRREELLKQLRAVEDAIAKKRSKLV